MSEKPQEENEVYQFILDQIESVPHLEALLLLWNGRRQPWTVEDLAKRLYVSTEMARALLSDLVQRRLVALVPGPSEGYVYDSETVQRDHLIAALDATYRREVVRVSTMIHSKPSSSLRDFARAFRFTKEQS